jgi:hypothetical protein
METLIKQKKSMSELQKDIRNDIFIFACIVVNKVSSVLLI